MGLIYAMTNASMPGLVKIGMTNKPGADIRARELQTTGVPVGFDVIFAAQVADARQAEATLHRTFRQERENTKREFFRIEPEDLVEALRPFDNAEQEALRLPSKQHMELLTARDGASLQQAAQRVPYNLANLNILSQWICMSSSKAVPLAEMSALLLLDSDATDRAAPQLAGLLYRMRKTWYPKKPVAEALCLMCERILLNGPVELLPPHCCPRTPHAVSGGGLAGGFGAMRARFPG